MSIKGFKIRYQLDSMQCGVAALAMICKHYGLRYSLSDIEAICQPSIEGVSMMAIAEAATKIGFETTAMQLTVEELSVLKKGPLILHWNHNHFVVLYDISSNGQYFKVADPAKGKIKYNLQEFKEHWLNGGNTSEKTGIGMLLRPTNNLKNVKGKQRASSISFLTEHIKKYRKYFANIIGCLLISCILQLIMPFLTQAIVDVGIKNRNISFIWLILFGELMIVIGRTATDFMRRWLLLHISMRINISLVSDFFIKLFGLRMSFFDTKLIGDLIQRIGDHGRVQSFLTGQLLNIMFTLLSFIVFGIVLFIYDSLIFAVFLLGSLVYAVWISTFLKRRKILDYEVFEQQSINQGRIYQLITTMQEIKLQDCEKRRRWEWEDTQADLFALQMKTLKLQQSQETGSLLINEIKNIIITIFAATAVINNHISLGAMLAIQYIVGQLNSPVEQLMSFIYSFQDVRISLERINEIHKEPNEEPSNGKLKKFRDNISHDIILNNVNFKYNIHSLKHTIENVSFRIPEGKVTAIVGTSGSGKTTLLKLILGYYELNGGTIRIANEPIESYSKKWWRRQCGVVMQDGFIFSESIARNIAVDDGNIDIDKLVQAATIARIHEYVMELPLKYDTLIGKDGIGLSQGQKQRILIARAIYKNPDFIFLDEATNSLDAANEKIIVENLDNFYKGRTVIIVAHRLSTVKNADQIIVLDSGKIKEIGTHEQLIDNKGFYFNLVKNQLELGE